ncbi:regulatory protein [Klebsiella pneumoniae]|uniref:Regulatory protein n=1 Tax=Klebsiella pneumoniae TaxID=573 RepID=A0A447RGX7_KLEPN|nr:regulatory protein [Klebsiella pneumoniae]
MLQIADSGRNGAGNEYKTCIVIRCGKAGRAVEGDPGRAIMNNSIVLPQDTIDRIETAIRELDYRGQ